MTAVRWVRMWASAIALVGLGCSSVPDQVHTRCLAQCARLAQTCNSHVVGGCTAACPDPLPANVLRCADAVLSAQTCADAESDADFCSLTGGACASEAAAAFECEGLDASALVDGGH